MTSARRILEVSYVLRDLVRRTSWLSSDPAYAALGRLFERSAGSALSTKEAELFEARWELALQRWATETPLQRLVGGGAPISRQSAHLHDSETGSVPAVLQSATGAAEPRDAYSGSKLSSSVFDEKELIEKAIALGQASELHALDVRRSSATMALVDLLKATFINPAWTEVHGRVLRILEQQRLNWPRAYGGGYLYQGYELLGFSGWKPTLRRLSLYQAESWIKPGDSVLDIGSNCGFVAIEIARRGARVDAVEVNPYLGAVASEAARWLGVTGANFVLDDLQTLAPSARYDVALSLANHGIIDGRTSLPFADYAAMLADFVVPGGTLMFESHDPFGPGRGAPGDDGDLDAKFDILERWFEPRCHRMTGPFVPTGDIAKLFVVLERRSAPRTDSGRLFCLESARQQFEMCEPGPTSPDAGLGAEAVGQPTGGGGTTSIASLPVVWSPPEITHRTAFVLHVADMVNHYREVWRWMDSSTFDIVLVGEADERRVTRQMVADQEYTCIDLEDVVSLGRVYQSVVANHAMQWEDGANVLARIGVTRVRFFYAMGKSRWNFASWNDRFDLLLVQGPVQAMRLGQVTTTPVVQMGYPRFDRIANGEVDTATVRVKLGCRADRPLVAWLPTWGATSSVSLWCDAVAGLLHRYDVVVKPHPLSWEAEPENIARLRSCGFTSVVVGHIDTVDIIAAADVVLADYGGSPFGAIIADRPLLLLDVEGDAQDETIGEDSLDVSLRGTIDHLAPDRRHELESVVSDEARWVAQRGARAALRRSLVAPTAGFAGRVAAAVIEGFMQKSRSATEPSQLLARRQRDIAGGWLPLTLADLSVMQPILAGRRLVGWGTGGYYRAAQAREHLDLAYLVDTSTDRHGLVIDGLEVHPPSRLIEDGSEAVFVVRYSMYRDEIGQWLDAHGFELSKDYC